MSRYLLLVVVLAGCDQLFALTHVPEAADSRTLDGTADTSVDAVPSCPNAYTNGVDYHVPQLTGAVAIADIDDKNGPDIVANGYGADTLAVLMNRGDGTFVRGVDVTTGSAPSRILLTDWSGEGVIDMLVTNYLASAVNVYQGNATGNFLLVGNVPTGVGTNPSAIAVGKLDADDSADLVVTVATTDKLQIYLNDGAGGATPQPSLDTGDFPQDVVLADLDGDVDLDIIVVNNLSSTLSLFSGNGNGTFNVGPTVSVCSTPIRAVVGQLDTDNHLDVLVTCKDGTVDLLHGIGNGTFGTVDAIAGGAEIWDAAIGNLDNDSVRDVAFPQYTAAKKLRVYNGSSSGFTSFTDYPGHGAGDAIAIADLDQIPPDDIVVGNWDESIVTVFLADCMP